MFGVHRRFAHVDYISHSHWSELWERTCAADTAGLTRHPVNQDPVNQDATPNGKRAEVLKPHAPGAVLFSFLLASSQHNLPCKLHEIQLFLV